MNFPEQNFLQQNSNLNLARMQNENTEGMYNQLENINLNQNFQPNFFQNLNQNYPLVNNR